MSSNSFKIADNNLVKEADDYIRKNRLVELFEEASLTHYNDKESLTNKYFSFGL